MNAHDAEIIREMIRHENEQINNRVSWLMTFQGLLFACLGFVWDKPMSDRLIVGLCILGILVSVLCFFTLHAATTAILLLYDSWAQGRPTDYHGPDVVGLPPPKVRLFRYLAAWILFPLVLAVSWVFVWYVKKG